MADPPKPPNQHDDGVTQRLVLELAEVRRRMAAHAQQKGRTPPQPPVGPRRTTSGSFDAIKEPLELDIERPKPENEES